MMDRSLGLQWVLFECLSVDFWTSAPRHQVFVPLIDSVHAIFENFVNFLNQACSFIIILFVKLRRGAIVLASFEISFECLEFAILVLVQSLVNRVYLLAEQVDLRCQLFIALTSGRCRLYFNDLWLRKTLSLQLSLNIFDHFHHFFLQMGESLHTFLLNLFQIGFHLVHSMVLQNVTSPQIVLIQVIQSQFWLFSQK